MDETLVKTGVELILQGLDVDMSDRNFKETPDRVYRMYKELFERPAVTLPVFDESNDEMIVLRRHKTWGMCPHHLLPIQYCISIGYIPNTQVIGLSKLARLAESATAGLVLQESVAMTVTGFLINALHAQGAGCVVVGQHGCMQGRGVRTSGDVVTSSMEGFFREKPEVRQEFLNLVHRTSSDRG